MKKRNDFDFKASSVAMATFVELVDYKAVPLSDRGEYSQLLLAAHETLQKLERLASGLPADREKMQ